jgi:uncharacterized damage-inducible protein DinB
MTTHTTRPSDSEYAEFYRKYVSRVPDGDIVEILREQIHVTCALIEKAGEEKAGYAYAPGKWTVREVIGHLADAERIFAYRALRFARGDETNLAGFDETAYVPTGRFDDRSLASMLEEFRAVRAATIALYAGLPPEAWSRSGPANNNIVSVRALVWITAGHERHHRALLEERYFV